MFAALQFKKNANSINAGVYLSFLNVTQCLIYMQGVVAWYCAIQLIFYWLGYEQRSLQGIPVAWSCLALTYIICREMDRLAPSLEMKCILVKANP